MFCFGAALLGCIYLFSSCNALVSPPKDREKSSLVIKIDAGSGISSSWTETVDVVDVLGSGPDGASFTALNVGRRTPVTFTVEPGNWSITAQAKNVEGTLVAHGTADVTVRSGDTHSATLVLSQILSFVLTYDGNGADGGDVPAPVTFEAGATITIAGPGTMTRTGHTFTGWNGAPDGNGPQVNAGTNIETGEGDFTLYAQWTVTRVIINLQNLTQAYLNSLHPPMSQQ
jgi:uncharacterized repeat protein (TIGR02543 family)